MKACIVINNNYFRVAHAMALYLKKQHGVNNFSAYIFSPGAKEFIVHGQKDITYSPIVVDHEAHAAMDNAELDLEYLKQLEARTSPLPLWYHLYADRKLLMSIGPKEESTPIIDPLYDQKGLMKSVQVRAQAIEAMLRQSRPDFILFFAIGNLGQLLLYHIAKTMGIPCYNLDFIRVGNLIALSEDYHTLTGVTELFKQLEKKPATTAPEFARAKQLLEQFRATGSLDLEDLNIYENVHAKKNPLINVVHSVKYLKTLTANYLKNRKLFLYGLTDQSPWRFIGQKLKRRYRFYRGFDDLYSQPQDEDYAFFPLHYDPELATLVLAQYYFDQLGLIRQIARSLPIHFKLYVKEHPAMMYKRGRSFYKELVKIPNVRLIDHRVKSFELIKKAKLITTITGTVGWEASLLGKPVISFGEVFYNTLSFVRRLHDIETLPQVIHEQLHNFHYNEEETLRFLAAALIDGRPFNFAGLWYETDLQKLANDPGLRSLCDRLMEKVTTPHDHARA